MNNDEKENERGCGRMHVMNVNVRCGLKTFKMSTTRTIKNNRTAQDSGRALTHQPVN